MTPRRAQHRSVLATRHTSARALRSHTTNTPSQREEAQENQYMRRREEEQLKSLRDKAKKAQAEVEAQEKKVADLSKNDK